MIVSKKSKGVSTTMLWFHAASLYLDPLDVPDDVGVEL